MGLLGAAAKLRMLMSKDDTTDALKSLRSLVLGPYERGEIAAAMRGVGEWETVLRGTQVTTDPRSLSLRSWLRLTRRKTGGEGSENLQILKRLSQFEEICASVPSHTAEVERRHGYSVKAAGKVPTFGEGFLSLAQGGWVYSLARKSRDVQEKTSKNMTELLDCLSTLQEEEDETDAEGETEGVDLRGAHSHFLRKEGNKGGDIVESQKQANTEWNSLDKQKKEEYRLEAIAYRRAEKREKANSKLESLKKKMKGDMQSVEFEKEVWREIEEEVKKEYRAGAENCAKENLNGDLDKYKKEFNELMIPSLGGKEDTIELKTERSRFNPTKRTVAVVNASHAMDLFRDATNQSTSTTHTNSRAPKRKTDPIKQGVKLLERAYPDNTLDDLGTQYLAENDNILVYVHDPDENCLPDLTAATGQSINANSPSSRVWMVLFAQKSPKRFLSIELVATNKVGYFCINRIFPTGELIWWDSDVNEVRSNSSDAVATYVAKPIRFSSRTLQGGFRAQVIREIGRVKEGELKVDTLVKETLKRSKVRTESEKERETEREKEREMKTIAISSDISNVWFYFRASLYLDLGFGFAGVIWVSLTFFLRSGWIHVFD